MQSTQALTTPEKPMCEGERKDALTLCCSQLTREGYTVSCIVGIRTRRGPRPPDLLATNGTRVIRVFVLLERELDAAETKVRIKASLHEGETRVYVPWPLRWRALSNLDRWRLDGVAVATW